MNDYLRCLGDIERKIARTDPNVVTADLNELVCPKGRCRTVIDGANRRPDGLHFESPGADVVIRWLAPKLAGVAQEVAAARANTTATNTVPVPSGGQPAP